MDQTDIRESLETLRKQLPLVSEQQYGQLLSLLYGASLTLSDDQDTKNAAAIVSASGEIIAVGVNGLVPGVSPLPHRIVRPDKYRYFVHAETCALYFAASRGFCLSGSTIVCPWASCVPCASAIVASGVSRMVVHRRSFSHARSEWLSEVQDGHALLKEAGVIVDLIELPEGMITKARFDGREIQF